MENSLDKLSRENKEIYICGDFNIDLLKTETEKISIDFYALMNSNGLLPYIIHPSRVIEGKSATLIDNIFSNNTDDMVLSGNIYVQFSEHFSQFASVKREKIDIKKIVMYGRDWTKYDKDKFRDDVSNQQWIYQPQDPNVLMGDFITKLGTSSDKHVAIKKLNQNVIPLCPLQLTHQQGSLTQGLVHPSPRVSQRSRRCVTRIFIYCSSHMLPLLQS